MEDFKGKARAALALAGVEISPEDLAVVEMVAQAFEPGIRALDALAVSALAPEGDLDPGRPPRPAAAAA